MDEYYRAVRQLPSWLAQPLGQLPTSTAAQIHELRFRTGHGIFLTMSGRQVCLKELSAVTAGMHTGSAAARRDLSHSVRRCGPCTSERTDAGIPYHTVRLQGRSCRPLCGPRRADDPAAGAVIESADCASSSSDAAGQALRDPAKAFYRDACSR